MFHFLLSSFVGVAVVAVRSGVGLSGTLVRLVNVDAGLLRDGWWLAQGIQAWAVGVEKEIFKMREG